MKIRVALDAGARLPRKAHDTDAGFDLYTPVDFVLKPCGTAVIHTGVHMEIPAGYVGMIKSKSGLNVKHGIRCEGVVDAGYTGEIVCKMYNDGNEAYVFQAFDKITQIVILPIPDVELEMAAVLDATERGSNGFGSTGR